MQHAIEVVKMQNHMMKVNNKHDQQLRAMKAILKQNSMYKSYMQ